MHISWKANIAQNGSSVPQLRNKFHVGKIWALPIASKACVSADEFPLRRPSRKWGNEHWGTHSVETDSKIIHAWPTFRFVF